MSGLVNRNDYCQFLLVSQTNYTLTYFAKHSQRFSHDAPTRYLKRDLVKPNQVWQQSKQEIVVSPNGYLIFDDSVLDKNHSREIALVHRQYSGNEHRVIRGIGMVNCVYFNPELEEFWVIDYRIYDPSNDGKDKHEHVADMLRACFEKFAREELAFKAVLMDTWYATTKLMLEIHRAGILFYCPIKPNRTVSEIRVDQKYTYQQAETLEWTQEELDLGKQVHLKEFPAGLELKLFQVAVSTEGTELIVTSDHARKVRLMVKKRSKFTGFGGCAVCAWLSLERPCPSGASYGQERWSSFIGRSSRSLGSSRANAEVLERNAIMWGARYWCGCS